MDDNPYLITITKEEPKISHKTELKTELNNRHHLLQALSKLGLKFTEAKEGQKLYTKGNYGVKEEVDILLSDKNEAIGFKQKEDGTFTAVGDFYGFKLSANDLKCEVTALSKESEVAEHLMNLGFNEATGRKEDKEYIDVVYERYI